MDCSVRNTVLFIYSFSDRSCNVELNAYSAFTRDIPCLKSCDIESLQSKRVSVLKLHLIIFIILPPSVKVYTPQHNLIVVQQYHMDVSRVAFKK